jgi:hypothetical protein
VLHKEDARVETANVWNGFIQKRGKRNGTKMLTHVILRRKVDGIVPADEAKRQKRSRQLTMIEIIRRNGTGKYTVRSVERESVANRLALFLGMVE